MLTVAEIIEEAGAPAGAVSILPMSRELGDRMVSDERFKLLTFTGSPSVGWRMKERAGKKKVVLELGGNAGVIVDKTADLDWAVRRTLVGAFTYAGQVCISVQRMFVHEDIWDAFMEPVRRGRAGAQGRRPARSPDRDRARWSTAPPPSRTQRWVDEAVALGGKLLLGGKADGTFFPPTILTDVPVDGRRSARTRRSPRSSSRSRSATSTTRSARSTTRCSGSRPASSRTTWRTRGGRSSELEVGGVIVNDVPTYRIDHMPYGGVKDSGLGREGLRWAIEDMTEIRIMVLAQPQLGLDAGSASCVEPASRWRHPARRRVDGHRPDRGARRAGGSRDLRACAPRAGSARPVSSSVQARAARRRRPGPCSARRASEDRLRFEAAGGHLDEADRPATSERERPIAASLHGGQLPERASAARAGRALDQVLVQEQLGQATGGLWSFIPGAYNALIHCDADQRRRYLDPSLRGERNGSYAITEPGAGSDARTLAATATRDAATGDYVLNGEKWFVTGAAGHRLHDLPLHRRSSRPTPSTRRCSSSTTTRRA